MIIETRPNFKIIGQANNRLDALDLAAREQPNIILLDLLLNQEDGLELLPELLIAARNARILVLTGVSDTNEHYRAMRLGAMGIVHKAQPGEQLLKAIERVHVGEVWLDQSLSVRLLGEILGNGEEKKIDPDAVKIKRITAREREVILLIGEGMRNRQIADRLFISEVTVRHHLTSIFNKLEVKDRFELAIYAYRNGLAKPPFYSKPPVNGYKQHSASSPI